jgi:hypothetical protein
MTTPNTSLIYSWKQNFIQGVDKRDYSQDCIRYFELTSKRPLHTATLFLYRRIARDSLDKAKEKSVYK